MSLPVQIEQTSKKYKAKIILGVSVMLFGAVVEVAVIASTHDRQSMALGLSVAGGFVFLGAVLAIIGKAQAWWHHG